MAIVHGAVITPPGADSRSCARSSWFTMLNAGRMPLAGTELKLDLI
ncbi:hypothetical protein [Rhizobium mesoamericanum]|nr:hypothetical protein [Rhizobium mesoamericanum]